MVISKYSDFIETMCTELHHNVIICARYERKRSANHRAVGGCVLCWSPARRYWWPGSDWPRPRHVPVPPAGHSAQRNPPAVVLARPRRHMLAEVLPTAGPNLRPWRKTPRTLQSTTNPAVAQAPWELLCFGLHAPSSYSGPPATPESQSILRHAPLEATYRAGHPPMHMYFSKRSDS